jgi:predicted DNA-binding WGR domain protein
VWVRGCARILSEAISATPNLAGIGKRFSTEQLIDYLVDPPVGRSPTRMPDCGFNREEAAALAARRLLLRQRRRRYLPMTPARTDNTARFVMAGPVAATVECRASPSATRSAE